MKKRRCEKCSLYGDEEVFTSTTSRICKFCGEELGLSLTRSNFSEAEYQRELKRLSIARERYKKRRPTRRQLPTYY